jgi:hypothetical protein
MSTESKIQSSIVIPSSQSIIVKQPTGVGAFVISTCLAEGTAYDHTDALLAAIEAELQVAHGGGWTLAVDADTGIVSWTLDAGGTFDIYWSSSSTWIRDWLGWAADVINATNTTTAPGEHLGGLYLLRRYISGNIREQVGIDNLTHSNVTLGGYGSSVAADQATRRTRRLVLPLTRDSGDWREFRQFELFIDQVCDGRTFWIWDDPDDVTPDLGLQFIGPHLITYAQESKNYYGNFQVSLECTEVTS